jgi:hypothetical protein
MATDTNDEVIETGTRSTDTNVEVAETETQSDLVWDKEARGAIENRKAFAGQVAQGLAFEPRPE